MDFVSCLPINLFDGLEGTLDTSVLKFIKLAPGPDGQDVRAAGVRLRATAPDLLVTPIRATG